MLRHRQALASFARRRARKTKKKWALKYDELYFNGRVFVFDEDSNRVEAAWRTSEQQMSPKANLSKVWEMPFRWKIFTRVNSGQIGEFIGKYQYLISCLYLHSVVKVALKFILCLTLSFRFRFTPSSIFIKSSRLLNKIGSLLQIYYENF